MLIPDLAAAAVADAVADAAEQVAVATAAPLGNDTSIDLAHAHYCWYIDALARYLAVATKTETGQQS